jgi:glycosyltransferase involved in cell wall biosynthesis
MDLSKFLTIVIPCKNEKDIILKTLDLLNYQSNIFGVKVIVCDDSNDGITKIDLIDSYKEKESKLISENQLNGRNISCVWIKK